MQLGRATLTRRPVDPFDAVRLKGAYYRAESPLDDDLALVALTLSTDGHGIPPRRSGQTYADYGASLMGAWILATAAPPSLIQTIAHQAALALDDGRVTLAALDEARDFFGLPALSRVPDSASGTVAATSSEVSP